MLLGTAASPGIAIGPALVVRDDELIVTRHAIDDPKAEFNRLLGAIERAKAAVQKVHAHALASMGADHAAVFEAHLLMLEDPEMLEQVQEKIESEGINAEAAYQEVAQGFIRLFEGMKNAYMKERAADVRDISDRILRALLGQEKVDLSRLDSEAILVGQDFTPSDTATLDRAQVLGLVTAIGGRTSHTAIMARTLGLPAVVGLANACEVIRTGDTLIIDGSTGQLHIRPEPQVLERYRALALEQAAAKAALESVRGQPSVTLDGHHVELSANIGTPKDVEALKKGDAEGVGLFRTEFLYMNRDTLPSEEEQYQAYKEVLTAIAPRQVIIRTLDIGGDKSLPYLPIPKEANPFLGYRAIRICLDRLDLFKQQLRALLRASAHGNLAVMFPMISSLDELLAARRILDETRQELLAAGVEVANKIPVGIMIEIPAAAMIADILARHCDFFSIGTNDLIQYTCAVDRMNEKIHHLYNSSNPGVLRTINKVIQDAHAAGIRVGMCGEVAGELPLVPVLLGMGLDEFSMTPNSILEVRRLIRSLKAADARQLAQEVLSLSTAGEIEDLTRRFSARESLKPPV